MARKDEGAEEAEPIQIEQPSELSADLRGIFDTLMAAERLARDEAKLKDAARLMREAIGGLPDEVFRQVVATEGLERLIERTAPASGVNPGEAVLDEHGREIYRVAYSYEWLCEHMEMVEWIVPSHQFGRRIWESVSWNGVQCPVVLRVGESVRTPSCFRDIVYDSVRETSRALSGQTHVLAGVGARAADGVSVETGFAKQTDRELLNTGEWRER